MGYTTEFIGSFKLDKPLDAQTAALIHGLSSTRRMARDLTKIGLTEAEADAYGIEGEFYCSESEDASVLDVNKPPSTQPGLWLQWIYNVDNCCIEWDSNEKFYNYVEWLDYIIDKVLASNYILNGTMLFQGEHEEDCGKITVCNNEIKCVYDVMA